MRSSVTEFYITEAERIEASVRKFFDAYIPPLKITRLGLAVSGGADSTALFHLLLPLCRLHNIQVVILHLNHGLREESLQEARFVEALASDHQLDYFTKTLTDLKRRSSNLSLEMAARKARLQFYAEAYSQHSLDAIATGHHADDLAETMLLRLGRGAGIEGLSGIKPLSYVSVADASKATLTLLRPLLPSSSSALRDWLLKRDLKWFEDSSNSDSSIPRNNIRHRIMPFLREHLQKDIAASLCRSAAILLEDDRVLNEIAEKTLREIQYNNSLLTDALRKQPVAIQRRMIRLWLFNRSLSESTGLKTVDRILRLCAQSEYCGVTQLNSDTLAVIENHMLTLRNCSEKPNAPPMKLEVGTTVIWNKFEITTRYSKGIQAISRGVAISPATCSISVDKINGRELIVRQRLPGDRIMPTGLQGSVKIKDVLINAKVPRHERDQIPIFTCDAEIIWLPGYRISRNFTVDSDSTAAIQIEVKEKF